MLHSGILPEHDCGGGLTRIDTEAAKFLGCLCVGASRKIWKNCPRKWKYTYALPGYAPA